MTALPLPAICDTAAAATLRPALLDLVDARRPLLLDASGVERIGLAVLQLLLAARTAATAAGLAFTLAAPSAAAAEMIALAGLDDALGRHG